MKKIYIAAALAALTVFTSGARSAKRGVSESSFHFKAQIEALEPGVCWYYTWGSTVGRYLADEEMEFVPMVWNGNYDADAIREYVKSHPQTKYLLGFNEPNFTNQANMTPTQAAERWPAVKALAAELGLKLVAPALNYSPNPPYYSPTQWMDEFVALVGKDAFDFTAIHSYGGDGVMKDLATQFHDRYGKDVWVTEFCYWPDEGNPNSTVTQTAQINSMVESVEWLEKTEWIYRYAWFKAIGNYDADKGPNYGLLVPGTAENPRELSPQGKVYLYMSNYDANVWNACGTTFPATEYINRSQATLGPSPEGTAWPIEITGFNAGASLDWQFDVPEAGQYNLVLSVSGYGEPTRYDPVVAVYGVAADGSDGDMLAEQRTLTLPNSDTSYQNEIFTVNLSAGHQTLRLKDMNPYRPSGMRISTVTLTDAAGVEGIDTDMTDVPVDVYSMQGVMLRRDVNRAEALTGLPAGIYIVGGVKTVKY